MTETTSSADLPHQRPLDRLAPIALHLSFVALLGTAVVIVVAGPEQVAAHTGAGGEVTRWQGRISFAITMAAIGTGLWALFAFSPRWIARAPRWALNVPHPEYWAREGRPRLAPLMRADMAWFGALTLMLLAPLMLYLAFGEGDVPMWPVAVGVGLYLVALGGHLAWMIMSKRYHPPAGWSAQREDDPPGTT